MPTQVSNISMDGQSTPAPNQTTFVVKLILLISYNLYLVVMIGFISCNLCVLPLIPLLCISRKDWFYLFYILPLESWREYQGLLWAIPPSGWINPASSTSSHMWGAPAPWPPWWPHLSVLVPFPDHNTLEKLKIKLFSSYLMFSFLLILNILRNMLKVH